MDMPPDLRQAIDSGLVSVHGDRLHHLEQPYRQLIWRALGPKLDRSRPGGDVGLQRRTLLEWQAVRRVLPLWEAIWPTDVLPHELLDEALRVLRGEVPEKTVRAEVDHGWSACDARVYTLSGQAHLFEATAGYGAVKVVRRAMWDEGFDPSEPIDWQSSDATSDPFTHDASFDALLAAEGGWPGTRTVDISKALTFWEWWLTEAVPSAWAVVPDQR